MSRFPVAAARITTAGPPNHRGGNAGRTVPPLPITFPFTFPGGA